MGDIALPRRYRAPTFADVLHYILPAADTFIVHLRGIESLPAFRLTSRALRDFIDTNVRELTLAETADNWHHLKARRLPSLPRWPSCEVLHLELSIRPSDEEHTSPTDEAHTSLAALAVLPFTEQYLSAQQRIMELTLAVDDRFHQPLPVAAIASLAPYVPSLRVLDLGLASCTMESDPTELQVMYDALRNLPYLEELTLPSTFALDGIGALAGVKLKHLFVDDSRSPGLDNAHKAYSSISRLPNLTTLHLGFLEVDSEATPTRGVSLAALLDSLPPALEQLVANQLIMWPESAEGWLEVRLSSGRVDSVAAASYLFYDDGNIFYFTLAAALLDSKALKTTKHRLSRLDLAEVWSDVHHPAEQPLLELMRRSDYVDVGTIFVEPMARLQTLDLLGKPRKLCFMGIEELKLRLRRHSEPPTWAAAPLPPHPPPPEGQPPQQPQGPATSQQQQQQQRVLPAAREVVQRVLRTLTSPARSSHLGAASGVAATAAAGDEGGEAQVEAAADFPVRLLLWGNLIPAHNAVPGALEFWLRGLAQKAFGQSRKCLGAYLALPSETSAVMLQCSDEDGAAAAVAAAAVRSAAGGQAAGVLQVAPVGEPDAPTINSTWFMASLYTRALRDVLQRIWDERGRPFHKAASGGGGSVVVGERELLQHPVRGLQLGELASEVEL